MSRDLESYIRKAHAERAYYIGELISSGIFATAQGIAWSVDRVRRAWSGRTSEAARKKLAAG